MLEQHPVPQNVTTFQFRLIGDMTIKQFGYLAGGAILAYISYNLPFPFFFRWPLTGVFALGGIGFAFVPIEERPMDVWFLSFIKSIYSPTLYLWQREESLPVAAGQPATAATNTAALFPTLKLPPPPSLPFFGSKQKKTVISPLSAGTSLSPAPVATRPKSKIFPSFGSFHFPSFSLRISRPKNTTTARFPQPSRAPAPAFIPAPIPGRSPSPSMILPSTPIPSTHQDPPPLGQPTIQSPSSPAVPLPGVTGTHLNVAVDTNKSGAAAGKINIPEEKNPSIPYRNGQTQTPAMEEMEQRMQELEKKLQNQDEKENRVKELEQQLVNALSEKNTVQQELERFKQQASQTQRAAQQTQPSRVASVLPSTPQEQPRVHIIPPESAKRAGIPTITSIPNVVSGIIRDNNGNLLTGILVTVKDKEDVPLRALKTNKLGQFAASTPLTSGTYTLEIEDPKNQVFFDLVKVTLNGSVLPPIEIIAKTKQQLERMKLEQAVFGTQKI